MGYQKLGVLTLLALLFGGTVYFFAQNSSSILEDSNGTGENSLLREQTGIKIPNLSLGVPFERIAGSTEIFGRKSEKQIFQSAEKEIENQQSSLEEENYFDFKEALENVKISMPQFLFIDNKGGSNVVLPIINENELNISNAGVKNEAEYYIKFIDTVVALSFSDEEREVLKKDNTGAFLLLEELISEAEAGINLESLRSSFVAWKSLDEKILSELKKMPVDRNMIFTHKSMLSWYQYHYETAKKLSEEILSANEINKVSKNFATTAQMHTAFFRESVNGLDKKEMGFFLIPRAQAFTCASFFPPGFYNFGGRVTVMLPCNWGIVETISPPCGGMFLFNYGLLIANPYAYKKPTFGSAILGRSSTVPGVCILGVCPACTAFPYEAVVLFFGTSLIP